MAKGASTETELGNLHGLLTKLFTRVVSGYLTKLEALEAMSSDVVQEEVLSELIAAGFEPSPAMLSAISKFLKDNEISFDSEQVDALSELEAKLQRKKENRPVFSVVTDLPLTGTS